MAITDIRQRLTQVAFRAETVVGTDVIAAPPAAADYVTGQWDVRWITQSTPNAVQTGSYDGLPDILGGMLAEITGTFMIVGSGAAGTAPEWGKILTAARMIETVTGAAVGAPTAASAGTATTVTAASPFAATAQLYRGMPVLLAGNPAAGATDAVLDYTAGRVITLGNTYSPVLSGTTTLQVPINVLYSPTDDDTVEKWLTCYMWRDKLRHIVTGCKVRSLQINLRSGAPASITVTLVGVVVSRNQAITRPAGYTAVTRTPPVWLAGLSRLNRVLAQAGTVTLDAGIRASNPDNQEATQGYDPANITGAAPRVTLDPYSHSTNTPARSAAMTAQTSVPYIAQWGSTAGNRFLLSCPSGVVQDLQNTERNELGVDQIVLVLNQPGANFFLACY